MMTRLLLLFLLIPFFACSHASGSRADSGFLKEIDDVPVPEGFAPDGDDAVTYDTPAGRIVETSIRGNDTEKHVEEFYTQTLPQVGWEKAGGAPDENNDKRESEVPNLSFTKEGETLDLFLTHEGGDLLVRFSLYPSKK